MKNCSVIIVLYNPSAEIVNKWINTIKLYSDIIFVFVDNSMSEQDNYSIHGAYYLYMNGNKGIAYAQNKGIEMSKELGATYTIFFDQDSNIPQNYFSSILSEYIRIKTKEPRLAILGPQTINMESNEVYKNKEFYDENDYCIMPCLISSGTIVEIESFRCIGLLEEALFIDLVDFEWCWRAISKGYKCAKTNRVALPHKVGQSDLKFFGFPIIISSSFRYYFQYRNALLMIKRKYVPKNWKYKTSIRNLIELFIVPIYSPNHIKTLKNMVLGIYDGVINNFDRKIK